MPVPSAKAKGLKRKRSPETDPPTALTPPPEPFWKRGGFQSAEEANAAFWDNLSKVPLCSRALEEFDRRNSLFARSGISSARTAVKSITRSAARSAALNLLSVQHGTVEECTNELKRFARRGGSDLRNLRGVRMNYAICMINANELYSIQNPSEHPLQATACHPRKTPTIPLRLPAGLEPKLGESLRTIPALSKILLNMAYTRMGTTTQMTVLRKSQVTEKRFSRDLHHRDYLFHRLSSSMKLLAILERKIIEL